MVQKTALSDDELQQKLQEMAPEWKVDKNEKGLPFIYRVYRAKEYLKGIDFVRQVAEEAEKENHHPDILIHYKRITVRYWTHTVSGVTMADVEMAQQIDPLFEKD
ncbi:putative Pterin-4-alpha-carbinolamine dehydratase [Nitrospina gracilis 3/211]|uniref:Putative pterin-4-alpha-carbinolamine dehydratase n=1 Tax=Nitrospina gracilis (strain 3/211) TaxID=1266370 RepID=M1YZZ6_NITG3|nr:MULTISPECIES: 4a-hydroxytetrahydrobiopterin dehydratase [Nitrospina]MCF8723935.1 4a-hydroxytetrahydrobiopterin dehydratase [Nitrospina sp. Nb-3]CCQ91058.1 putative Pterin-4-alpha-carbinolamine dehydratase [Nitrospina gracilis 3/211]